jgi:hypothetical protein
MGCTRVVERVAASLGGGGATPTRFEPALDVRGAGVLWAIPALLANGLLRDVKRFFPLREGYYALRHIFLLLAFMALCRIKTIEQLRYHTPGELGKPLGLDRVPEVRTVRMKLKELAGGDVEQWGAQLAGDWLEADGEEGVVGRLYVDGHVRPYHGRQTALPRRYVSRQRLCLRGLTDYWINGQTGKPFFVVSTPFSDGLLWMLRQEIVPRLLRDVPGQPTPEELERDPELARFTLICDREGYSPAFFRQMWEDHRVACQTYRKSPGADWPVEEFVWRERPEAHGRPARWLLAERPLTLSNGFLMREIRRLSAETGHQTAIVSSDWRSETAEIAHHMFSRWSQENFFKYMLENFDLDGLASYATEGVDETRLVVSPQWRDLSGRIKRLAAQLGRKRLEFASVSLHEDLRDETVSHYDQRKGQLLEAIAELEEEIAELQNS